VSYIHELEALLSHTTKVCSGSYSESDKFSARPLTLLMKHPF